MFEFHQIVVVVFHFLLKKNNLKMTNVKTGTEAIFNFLASIYVQVSQQHNLHS